MPHIGPDVTLDDLAFIHDGAAARQSDDRKGEFGLAACCYACRDVRNQNW